MLFSFLFVFINQLVNKQFYWLSRRYISYLSSVILKNLFICHFSKEKLKQVVNQWFARLLDSISFDNTVRRICKFRKIGFVQGMIHLHNLFNTQAPTSHIIKTTTRFPVIIRKYPSCPILRTYGVGAVIIFQNGPAGSFNHTVGKFSSRHPHPLPGIAACKLTRHSAWDELVVELFDRIAILPYTAIHHHGEIAHSAIQICLFICPGHFSNYFWLCLSHRFRSLP